MVESLLYKAEHNSAQYKRQGEPRQIVIIKLTLQGQCDNEMVQREQCQTALVQSGLYHGQWDRSNMPVECVWREWQTSVHASVWRIWSASLDDDNDETILSRQALCPCAAWRWPWHRHFGDLFLNLFMSRNKQIINRRRKQFWVLMIFSFMTVAPNAISTHSSVQRGSRYKFSLSLTQDLSLKKCYWWTYVDLV